MNGEMQESDLHFNRRILYEQKPESEEICTGKPKKSNKGRSLSLVSVLSCYPFRFRRQYVIGNYIADFYCHQAGLVIELDGSQHYDPTEQDKDALRTAYMEALGLKVLRFTNLDIQQRFKGVCEAIDGAVKERTNCTGK